MRKVIATLAAAGAVIVLGTGSSCGRQDPCQKIPPSDAELVRIVAQHPNIEIDYVTGVRDIECDLVDGRWKQER